MTDTTPPSDEQRAAEALLDRKLDKRYPAGEPLPESSPHEIVRGDVAMVLRQHFASRDDIWVASNRNLYYLRGIRRAVVEPDVMVVSGVSKARLDKLASYRRWQHGGSIRFVLEVTSQSTLRADQHHKRSRYARLRVAEYWRVDPTGGTLCAQVLEGERLVKGRWAPIPVTESENGSWWGRSDALALDLVWQDEELLLYRPGEEVPKHNLARAEDALDDAVVDLRDAQVRRDEAEWLWRRAEWRADRAEQRADEVEQRRDEAEQRAAAQEAEINRLNELLRRDPPVEDSEGDDPQPPGATS
ncbi:MAG: Uma2 family endonuclease [bacterium]|nr:Uma2 family endonuclease [bacterium]MDE0668443.1 Uma2 family endonuclease [bacterium]